MKNQRTWYLKVSVLGYLHRRITLTFTPSSGGFALTSAMLLSAGPGVMLPFLALVGDLKQLSTGAFAARTGRLVA